MKTTMPILIVMLLAGSAFGWEAVEDPSELSARIIREMFSNSRGPGGNRQEPGGVTLAKQAAEAQTPYVPTPDKPSSASSTSYSIITLPDGQTASVLTFK